MHRNWKKGRKKERPFLDTTNGSYVWFFIASSVLSIFAQIFAVCCYCFFVCFFVKCSFRFKCNFQSFYLLLTVCNVTNYYRAYWCVYTSVLCTVVGIMSQKTFANLLCFPLDFSSSTTMLRIDRAQSLRASDYRMSIYVSRRQKRAMEYSIRNPFDCFLLFFTFLVGNSIDNRFESKVN